MLREGQREMIALFQCWLALVVGDGDSVCKQEKMSRWEESNSSVVTAGSMLEIVRESLAAGKRYPLVVQVWVPSVCKHCPFYAPLNNETEVFIGIRNRYGR